MYYSTAVAFRYSDISGGNLYKEVRRKPYLLLFMKPIMTRIIPTKKVEINIDNVFLLW